jgi:hypothetical protein
MVQHLGDAERHWFQRVTTGSEADLPGDEGRPPYDPEAAFVRDRPSAGPADGLAGPADGLASPAEGLSVPEDGSVSPVLGRDAEACAEMIDGALSGIAVATRRQAAAEPSLEGPANWLVLNAAHLLNSDRAGEFAAVARARAGTHRGMRADLTGP